MKINCRRNSFLPLAAALALLVNQASALTITWNGAAGAPGNWSAANWVSGTPVAGDLLQFGGVTTTTTNNDLTADTNFIGINFTNNGTAGTQDQSFTLAGARITLGGNITTTAVTGTALNDTISLAMILDGNRTITTNTLHNLAISGIISETGGARTLNKAGAGTLTLTGNNTFSGGVTINANGGTVSAGHNNALGTGGTVSINSNTSLEIQNGITINNPLTATDQGNAKNLRLKDGATSATYSGNISILETSFLNFDINVATGGTLTISGIVSGQSFEKVGAGTLILTGATGANTYSLTTITGGIVDFANKAAKPAGTATAGASGSVGLGVKASDAAYYSATDVGDLFNTNTLTGFSLNAASGVAIDTTNAGADFDQTVALTAARALTKLGTGTLILSQTNTYTGATTVSAGSLSLGHLTDTLSSSSAVTVDGATAVLAIAGNSDTVGAVSLKNGGSINGTGGTLTGSSYAVESGSVSAILGGAVALTKSTAGTVTLTGANTYSGTTTVSAGALEVNNTTGSGTGSGTVTVDSTLKGDGSITAAANNYVYLNGTLQVGQTGATVGQDFSLTTSGTGSTIFGVSSILGLDLWSTTGTDQSGTLAAADMLRLFGDVSIAGTSLLKLGNPNAFTFQAGDMFKVFDWAGLGTLTGTFATDFTSITLAPGTYIDSSNLYTAGTISIASIPEPSRALLMLLGVSGVLVRRRRVATAV